MHYNYIRIHQTLRHTLAMAASVTTKAVGTKCHDKGCGNSPILLKVLEEIGAPQE